MTRLWRSIRATALAIILLQVFGSGVALADASDPGGTFTDDNGSVYEGAIEAIAAKGITFGCNPPRNDKFCVEDTVTRGQMAAFIARAGNLPSASHDYFEDDNRSNFEDAINRIAEAGITRGCNPPANDRFCPTRTITRGEMAAFLARAFDKPPSSTDHFDDDNRSIFEDAINRIADAGITLGCNPPTNSLFCPGAKVTRGQMAAFIMRALELTPLKPPPPAGSGSEGGDPVDPGEGYAFIIDNRDTGGDWWRAPYLFELPYAAGFGWGAGDRIAYGCVYGFLIQDGARENLGGNNWDLAGGNIYGRFLAVLTVPDDGAYLRVNDAYMVEGRRFFDGSPGDGRDQLYSSGFCADRVSQDYKKYTGAGERPVIKYHTPSGEVAEVRDYRTVKAGVGVKFRLVDGDGSDGRVAVVAYKNDLPGVVVYYDALNGGSVSASVPG
ncbi:MAG TPA: hypothetical protein VFV13_01145 [Acidimicrobiia bacterium]|nr:hypothetical protein [Acidimicrobiia bacterium]